MLPKIALLLGFCLIAYTFIGEKRRKAPVSWALIWPLIWYLVAASRPFGAWLQIWGIPIGGGSGGAIEGSAINRNFYTALTIIGLIVLASRPVNWRRFFRENIWLILLLSFMLLSVLWSEYSYVSFKRFIKMIGSVIMALVILTERRPFEAISALIRRCAYIHIVMSFILVKYFRHLGVSFGWDGSGEAWQGIATSKNVLGQVAMIAGVYFIWEVMRDWQDKGWRQLNLLYTVMAIYLLKGSDDSISLTAVSVFTFALIVFTRLGKLRSHPYRIRPFLNLVGAATLGLLALVMIHSVVLFSEDSLFGSVITTFGRDITLTDRTVIWGQVYDVVSRQRLFGIGFGGFWIGETANIPFSTTMSWTLGQAHSGYVDTYMQIGWIGIILLAGLLATSFHRLVGEITQDFERGRFLLTLLMTTLFVNITETTFLRGDHHLWLIFLLVAVSVHRLDVIVSAQDKKPDTTKEDWTGAESMIGSLRSKRRPIYAAQ